MLSCKRIFRKNRIGLLVVLWVFFIYEAKAQITVEVYVSGQATGVNAPVNYISNKVSATLKDSGGNVLVSKSKSSSSTYTSALLISYSDPFATSFSGKVLGLGSYISDCRNPGDDTLVPGCRTAASASVNETDFSFSGGSTTCSGIYYNTTTGYYNVTITVVFYSPIAKPTSAMSGNGCGGLVTLSVSDAASSFTWQVSEDNLNWHTFRTSAPSAITTSVNELYRASFTSPYSNRYVRVFSTDCSGKRMSGPSTSFNFLSPPPIYTISSNSPTCHDGLDGTITINITGGGNSYNEYKVDLVRPDGALQQAKIIGTSRTFDNSAFSIMPGNWSITVMNYRELPDGSGGDSQIGTCSGSITLVTVGNRAAFTLNQLGSTPVSCHVSDISSNSKKSDGSITLNLTNGNSAFTYQYAALNGTVYSSYNPIQPNSSTSLTPTFSNLPKGIYKFKSMDSKSCNSNELDNISVNAPSSQITVTDRNKINVECKDVPQGSVDIGATGGNGGFSYAWSGPNSYSSSNEDISNVYSGTYSLTVTDVKGCVNNSYSTSITQPATKLTIIPVKSIYGNYNTSCLIYDGTIDLTYQNKKYTIVNYEWKKNGFPLSPVPSNKENLSSLSPGSYYVKVKDTKGCEATSTIEMTANPGIVVSALATSDYNGYNTKCNSPTSIEGEGKVIVANSFGTLQYVWDHDPDLNSSLAYDLPPGTYHVSVTDGNHCIDDDNLVITPPPSIQAHLKITSDYNGSQISCPGAMDGRIEAFPINGFGSYHYGWQHNRNLTSKFAPGLSKGKYTVTVKDDYNCSTEESITLNNPPSMKFLFQKKSYNGADISCYGRQDGGIILTVLNGLGSNSSYMYSWSNNASTKDVASLAQGDYRVSVTDGNRCVKDSSIAIVAPPELSIFIQHGNDFNGFDVRCYGEINGEVTARPTGGTGDYSYAWSNGVTTKTNAALNVGSYSVSVTDINGCKQAKSVTVTQPSPFTASLDVDNPVSCFGLSDGKVTLVGVGGVTPYAYSRDQSSWITSNVFSDLPAGDNDFFVRDNNGCMVTLNSTISEPAPLRLTFSDKIDAECNDPVGSVRAVLTGGNEGVSYSWFDDMTQEAKNQGNVLLNAIAGIYRVDVRDSKGCTLSDRTEISSTGGAAFEIINVSPTTCYESTDGTASINITSGIAPYSYSWSDGQTTMQASNLGKGKYFATVMDALQCRTIREIHILAPAQLSALYEKKLPLCVGNCNGRIEAIVSGGTFPYNYQWTDKNNNTNDLPNLCAGTYELLVTDANQCQFNEKIVLNDPEPLLVKSQIASPSCLGRCDGAIVVSGSGGTGSYQFEWDDGVVATDLTNRCADDFMVAMTDGNNCRVEQMLTIPKGEPIPIDLGTAATLCVGQSKILNAGIQWTNSSWTSNTGFASMESKISIKDPGYYFFEGIDERNCVALDTFRLETSTDLLKAEFLMPSEAMVGDTLVAIDISWPIPEKVDWNYPASFKQIPSGTKEILYAQPLEVGTFTLVMKSFLAECRDMREKMITVLAKDDESSQGRLGYEELIKEFLLSPNPNDGRFLIKIELSEEAQFRLRVVQYPSGSILSESVQSPSLKQEVRFDLSGIPQGVYIVLLDVKNQHRFVRFLKE